MTFNSKIIAGVDEVGRGCLFGPVFASAVILENIEEVLLLNSGLKDSKKLTKRKVEKLASLIKKNSRSWGIGQSSAREIDIFGIREATERAMIRALQKLKTKPDIILVDGILPIRKWKGKQSTIIKGESHSAAIAAASVIAKDSRDKLIQRISNKFKGYGLQENVGYGTKFHREAIQSLGPTKLHRATFLRKVLATTNSIHCTNY